MHRWELPTVSEARVKRRSRRINYNKVKEILDAVKILIKKESEPEVRRELANAGISLNKILLK